MAAHRPWLVPTALAAVLLTGLLAWRWFALPVAPPQEAAGDIGSLAAPEGRVLLLVTGLGMSQTETELALGLPAAVGMVFSSYAPSLAEWRARAVEDGHDSLIEIPLQSADPTLTNTGPKALSLGADPSATGQHLAGLLADVGPELKLVAVEAGAFGTGPEAFAPVAADLARRGLGLIELAGDRLAQVVRAHGLAYLATSPALDADLTPSMIDAELAGLEEKARQDSVAAGYIRPYPISVARARVWADGLAERGVTLSPISILLSSPGSEAVAR
jgi:polysaccharide deacetylase 2 family uncharacterized protein YibQ